jgi:hypothetical protein|tara:strand:+ start:144 stop:644 length:501 start_codon:yes stop_codon:yes gene_type:complete
MENRLKIASDLAARLGTNINVFELKLESQTITPNNLVITNFYYNDFLFVHSYLYISNGFFGTCVLVRQEEDIVEEWAFELDDIDNIDGGFHDGAPEPTIEPEPTPARKPICIYVYKSWKGNNSGLGECIKRTAYRFGEWYRLCDSVPSSNRCGFTFMVHESRVGRL